MLEGEITAHLGYPKSATRPDKSNGRNGLTTKKIKTEQGELDIKVPRDRKSEFEPQIVPKRSHLSKGIETLIISLYAKGMSNFDIEEQHRELYGFKESTTAISTITDVVTNDVIALQSRPLKPVYLVVWMDAVVCKVRENSRVINKAIYLAVG